MGDIQTWSRIILAVVGGVCRVRWSRQANTNELRLTELPALIYPWVPDSHVPRLLEPQLPFQSSSQRISVK